MNFLYTINNNFFEKLVVSLASLVKSSDKKMTVYVICDDITFKNKVRLEKFNSILVNIILLDSPSISKNLIPDRGSASQFYRLRIGEIFEDINIEKLLYLDADTIIVGSVEEIFNIDIGNNVIGATVDPWSASYRKLLHINTDAAMLNSGVLLINVKKWKMDKIDNGIRRIVKGRSDFIQGDQGLLDQFFNGHFFILAPKYNMISSYYELTDFELRVFRKPYIFYDKGTIDESKRNPVVIHFTSSFMNNRPWYEGSKHQYKDLWLSQYKEIYGQSFSQLKRPNSFGYLVYKTFPKRVSLSILKFLQNTVRPIFFKLKDRK